jgi:hypothetical protein
MLESNQYVCCILIDFSKAFDTVNHPILFSKLQQPSLPASSLAWIISFLTGQTQAVTHAGSICSLLHISRSIIQGSGLGPALYIIYKSDLRTLSALNKHCKFADDTTLLTPQSTDVQIVDEFKQILDWTNNNKLSLNLLKTNELIFCRPCFYVSLLPAPIFGIE